MDDSRMNEKQATEATAVALELCRRFGFDHVATQVGDFMDVAIAILGHCVYVRRCSRPTIKGDNGKTLLHLPDNFDEREKRGVVSNHWAEILAVGTRVGKPWNWRTEWNSPFLKNLPKPPKCLAVAFQKGDIVLVPQSTMGGHFRSPWAQDEAFIREDLLLAKYEG